MINSYIKALLGFNPDASDEEVREEWNKRTRNVCKPCWELKYCPYGPLVEDFPLPSSEQLSENDLEKRCSIFGHLCPVFFVNEPFTETKSLRRIGRYIPRHVMLKVVRRDNYRCQMCGKPLRDDEIEFDHIIPLSKGGSSEEHNIRVVCRECNRKKSNNFNL